jgi:predicted adenine nucleotide alpha hydrolase (AANH) superfamily ATPase
MKILLHICCGPCALVPMRALLAEGHEIAGAFVNPNIHPFLEFERRLEAARQASDALDVPIVHEDGYGLVDFLRAVSGHEDDRCRVCYSMRLERVAELAAELGYGAFSSSMLVSTHQDHEGIRTAGEAAGRRHGVEFVYRDFRPSVMDGVRESKEMGLYRQQYCGCIMSEWERYGKDRAPEGRVDPVEGRCTSAEENDASRGRESDSG